VGAAHRIARYFTAVNAFSFAASMHMFAGWRLKAAIAVCGLAAIHAFFLVGIVFMQAVGA